MALVSSKSPMEQDDDYDSDTEDPDIDAIFVTKIKKFLQDDKKGLKKSFQNNKSNSTSKFNYGPKPKMNVSKTPPKNTQCCECKGFSQSAKNCRKKLVCRYCKRSGNLIDDYYSLQRSNEV